MLPEVMRAFWGSSFMMERHSMLLPQPLSPTSASTSPSWRVRLTSRTACTVPEGVSRHTEKWSIFNNVFSMVFTSLLVEFRPLGDDLLLSTVTKVGKNTGRNLRFLHFRACYNVYVIVNAYRTITGVFLFRFVKGSSLLQRRCR